MTLENKVAIVTGASGGIGIAIVKALIDEGVKVLLADINEETLKKACEALGENAFYYQGDLTNKEVCNKVANYCREKFGKLDFLINSVGVAQRKPLMEVEKEEFLKLFDINVYTNLAMTQACLSLLEEAKGSDIISIVSSSGMYPHEGQGTYCATKFAQRALNDILNIELYDKNIRVHNLYPSAVESEMAKIARADLSGDVYCKPNELAEIIIFILSHRNNSVIDNLIVRRYTKRPDEI